MDEVAKIQKSHHTGSIKKNEGIRKSQPLDTVAISSESQKKSEWVEMLKEMPDVRLDKIAAAQAHNPSAHEVAHALLTADS